MSAARQRKNRYQFDFNIFIMKKTVITIFTAFIIVFCIVMLKNCCSYMLYNDRMGVRAVINRENTDVLFIGASSFRKGVDMHMVEDGLSENAFMLVYNGNQPMNMCIELEEIIGSGIRPKVVVVEFDPAMISGRADLSDKRLLWDISFKDKLKMWNYLKTRDDADLFMLYDFFVSSNMDYLATYPLAYPLISRRYYNGGNSGDEFTAGRTKDELDKLPIKEDAGFNELQKQSVIDIINMCNDNGIKLIFAESPNYVTMYDDENYAEKQELLKELLDSYDIPVYQKDDMDFDNSDAANYSDLTHMSSQGMEQYTPILIDIVKKHF